MKKFLLIVIGVVLTTICSYSQAGMGIYLGPSVMKSTDAIVTPGSNMHYGYVIGAHARLNSDNMYFLLSGEYGTFDLIANNSAKFIGGEDLTYAKGKIGLGFDIAKISRKIVLRSKLQGTVMFVNNFNQDIINNDPLLSANGYSAINDGIGGLATCIGIRFGSFFTDLEYEKGFFNLYHEKKDSKLNFISLTAGFQF